MVKRRAPRRGKEEPVEVPSEDPVEEPVAKKEKKVEKTPEKKTVSSEGDSQDSVKQPAHKLTSFEWLVRHGKTKKGTRCIMSFSWDMVGKSTRRIQAIINDNYFAECGDVCNPKKVLQKQLADVVFKHYGATDTDDEAQLETACLNMRAWTPLPVLYNFIPEITFKAEPQEENDQKINLSAMHNNEVIGDSVCMNHNMGDAMDKIALHILKSEKYNVDYAMWLSKSFEQKSQASKQQTNGNDWEVLPEAGSADAEMKNDKENDDGAIKPQNCAQFVAQMGTLLSIEPTWDIVEAEEVGKFQCTLKFGKLELTAIGKGKKKSRMAVGEQAIAELIKEHGTIKEIKKRLGIVSAAAKKRQQLKEAAKVEAK